MSDLPSANLFAYPPFAKRFGFLQSDGTYQLTAAWQSGLSNAPLVGEILGLFINGILAERFGYRKTIIGSLMLVVAFIFIVFFAKNLIMLCVGEILLGVRSLLIPRTDQILTNNRYLGVSSKPSPPPMPPRSALSLSAPILQPT
jgi:MFS family permease